MIAKRRASRATLATLAATGLIAAAQFLPAHASAESVACMEAGNVWVVVQADDTVLGGCATEFATGLEALTSAGFAYEAPGGFVTTVNGMPATPGDEDWWSYWNNETGTWTSYQVGANASAPKAGTTEGWRLWHSWTEMAQAPEFDPFAVPTPTPSPSVTASSTPSTTPTASASATPTTSETPSPSVTSTDSPTPTPVPAPEVPGLPSTGN